MLPANLGHLERITALKVGDNALSGRLPSSLSGLALSEFVYSGTTLCVPDEASFHMWLSSVGSHEGTELACASPTNREILRVFYELTGGAEWENSEDWLTDAPLGDWYGVSVDTEGRVVALNLSENGLIGVIPPDLGQLSELERLSLYDNELTGVIPPELGRLSGLERLSLSQNQLTGSIPRELSQLSELYRLSIWDNQLTGTIPPELGQLSRLEALYLGENPLTGVIPPELGQLRSLEWLYLSESELTGEIPPELGRLSSLERLDLDYNALTGNIPVELAQLTRLESLYLNANELTGTIPRELGRLSGLEVLDLGANRLTGTIPPTFGGMTALEDLLLDDNQLTGPVPPELGELAELLDLDLSQNPGVSGALPLELANLGRLRALGSEGTELCAPSDPGFLNWLEGVPLQRIPICGRDPDVRAYLVQAVQSREYPVPLIAERQALLRVFVTAARATSETIPRIRARFFAGRGEIHVAEIPASPRTIPMQVDESDLDGSANAVIPRDVVLPGLEMVVEIDPDGVLDPELGVARRIPETGRLLLDVRAMPDLDLTLIPYLWTEDPDSTIIATIRNMAADPEGHELLEDTRTLLPVGNLTVTAYEPVESSSNNALTLHRQTGAIRTMEGRTSGHYQGMMARPVTGASGVGRIGGRFSFSIPRNSTIAHELGHNMHLYHAPCGGAGRPDPSYPHAYGSIGGWGYDFDTGRLVGPANPDLMTYCGPEWVSDYHFSNALRYRLFDEGAPRASARPERALLVWGGASADSVPFLDPAFIVNAPVSRPRGEGAYRLTGLLADGREAFSLRFDMAEIADTGGRSSFVFALPAPAAWESELVSITITGPGGTATLDGGTDLPMVILRNPRSGQVRGFLRERRDLPAAAFADGRVNARVLSAEPGLEAVFSRGLPGRPFQRP